MPKAQLEKFSWELDEDDDLSTAAVSVIDEPVPQGKTDKLGISLHSEALTEFVEKTETPITVGIQGEWGSGKTSLINSIFHHFKNHPNVKQIEVNAWEYSLLSAPEEALVKIVGKIITDLVGEDPKNELVKNLKKRAAYIFRGALRVSAHVALGSDAAEATDALLDPESPDIRQLREDLEKVIDEMAKSGSNPYDRIIIYVDDLDRIEPKNAVAILELLKNFFSVKRCVFILAIDYDVVVKGLEDKFGKPTLENEWEFRAFFDKIIQLPFQMPMDDYSIAKYVNSLLFEVGFVEDKGLDEEKITEITRWTIGGNPRSIKRLVNSVSLNQIFAKKRKEKPGSPDSSSNRLVEGIDIKEEKLLLFSLYCLQIAYPPIYSLLLDEPDFSAWNRDFAFKQTNGSEERLENPKPEETESPFARELRIAQKTEDFNEDWEEALYRICYGRPRLKARVADISRFFSFIKDDVFKGDPESIIGSTIEQLLPQTSVTRVKAMSEVRKGERQPWKTEEDKESAKGLWEAIFDRLRQAENLNEITLKESGEYITGTQERLRMADVPGIAKLELNHQTPYIALEIEDEDLKAVQDLYDSIKGKREQIESKLDLKGQLVWKEVSPRKRSIKFQDKDLVAKIRKAKKRDGKKLTTPPKEEWQEVAEFFGEWVPKFNKVMSKHLKEIDHEPVE